MNGTFEEDLPDDRDERQPSVRQLYTGNLYLWVRSESGDWRISRTSVRLEPSLWEMLYEIAERERTDIHILARAVQERIDRRIPQARPSEFGIAESGSVTAPEDGRSPEGVERSEGLDAVNVSSALRAFIAAYFWKISQGVDVDMSPLPSRQARIETALVHVSVDYLRSAQQRIAARRAAVGKRGRPRRRA